MKSFISCICYLTLTSVVFENHDVKWLLLLIINLTLTSVVFEISPTSIIFFLNSYLTLTSVVFENCRPSAKHEAHIDIFNFNKCCI